MNYLLLAAGFVLLIKGADFFVDGSAALAKRMKVPSLIIGLTVVAMGTSLPECSVSVSASLQNKNELAVANAVGSNIFNLMAICGLCALFCPLAVQKSTLKKEFPFSIIAAAILMGLGVSGMVLGHVDGVILLVFFALFIAYMIYSALNARKNSENCNEDEYKTLPAWRCLLYIVGGAAAIAFGGSLVVDSASAIAAHFGLSDNLIGLTVVAFGTSLPELVTSVVAARKNEMDMALGNVIGSNIFNVLFVLGIAAAISPITFITENIIDTILFIAMSIMVLVFCIPKKKLVRWQGLIMLIVYTAYVVYICKR